MSVKLDATIIISFDNQSCIKMAKERMPVVEQECVQNPPYLLPLLDLHDNHQELMEHPYPLMPLPVVQQLLKLSHLLN
jgi:hypothetical protein